MWGKYKHLIEPIKQKIQDYKKRRREREKERNREEVRQVLNIFYDRLKLKQSTSNAYMIMFSNTAMDSRLSTVTK